MKTRLLLLCHSCVPTVYSHWKRHVTYPAIPEHPGSHKIKKKIKKIKGSFKCNLTAVSAHVLEIPVLVAGKLTCQRKQML